MIKYNGNVWYCPRCKGWTRVRGLGRKIRRCRHCKYKVIIETTYAKQWYLVADIISVEEIK